MDEDLWEGIWSLFAVIAVYYAKQPRKNLCIVEVCHRKYGWESGQNANHKKILDKFHMHCKKYLVKVEKICMNYRSWICFWQVTHTGQNIPYMSMYKCALNTEHEIQSGKILHVMQIIYSSTKKNMCSYTARKMFKTKYVYSAGYDRCSITSVMHCMQSDSGSTIYYF